MTQKKEKPPVTPLLSSEEIENNELALSSQSLEAQAKQRLDEKTLKLVKRVGYYITQMGLTLEEACILSDVEVEYFKNLMITEPLVKKIITIKEVQFKKDLLHTLSQRAKGGDDKLAQWFLERRYAEEFGTKKKGGDGDEESMLVEAIHFIQKNGDNKPRVDSERSGKAVIVSKKTTGAKAMDLLKSILK